MPIPNGQITTTEIWNNPIPEPQLEDAPLPEEPTEEVKEEE